MTNSRRHPASPAHSRLGAGRSTPTIRVSDGKLESATPHNRVENPLPYRDPRLEAHSQEQIVALRPHLRSQSKFQSP